ncbi:hypothetical protein WN51_12466 [Melipona quadrifasciata]|uniref:Uncharacterized protein n=1 Tax=Melipona quadrifasciata TaxID=166423 RepID=A0A0M9A4U6_9HYME|nr:hypothetical protein WN51_12466 [Melipona quadrifasciata]
MFELPTRTLNHAFRVRLSLLAKVAGCTVQTIANDANFPPFTVEFPCRGD